MLKKILAIVTLVVLLVLALVIIIPLFTIYLISKFIIAPGIVWSIYQLTGKKTELSVELNGNRKTKTKKRK